MNIQDIWNFCVLFLNLVTQKKCSKDNCIMLMIISIFYIAFPQHEHWRSCTACFYVTNLHTHLFLTKFHTYLLISLKPVVAVCGASSLEKRGLSGKAAFDIFFQHKTTLSLNTTNRPMNFAKYYIGKILPIHSILAIFTHKSRYASFLHGVFRNPSCYCIYD